MTNRKQYLVLFFQENEECNLISSRLVRLYMNRFTIDEDDETEVTQVHNVKNGTQEEYEECISESLVIARESETPNTYHHFIIGYSSVNDDKKSWFTKMLSFSMATKAHSPGSFRFLLIVFFCINFAKPFV